MKQYLDAVREILDTGTRKENRTGIDTFSTFGVYYEIDLAEGFPLLTTKAMKWEHIVLENLWFLSGDTTIKFLQDRKIKFWDAWADEEGRVPSAYGNFWRQFPVHATEEKVVRRDMERFDVVQDVPVHGFNDQIRWVIDELKRNPMSRRLVVSAWAPGNAQSSKLPPCHVLFVLNVQNAEVCGSCGCNPHSRPTFGECKDHGSSALARTEQRLNLHLTQRSCDIGLGVPYNIAGYAFLLHLFARFAGLKPGIMAHSLVDAHAYTSKPDGSKAEYDHVPKLREQLEREPRSLPRLEIDEEIQSLDNIEEMIRCNWPTEGIMERFKLHGYDPHPPLRMKVAV